MTDFSFGDHSGDIKSSLSSLKYLDYRRFYDLVVTVTNVTSYLGAQLCQTLLKNGHTVKGTVTNFEHNSALHELHEKLT